MALLRIEGLPDAPLDAAAAFHADWLPAARSAASADAVTTLVLVPADHTHRAWRRAAVQELARVAVPNRVNAIASDSGTAIAAAADFLAAAEGVTGQYLMLDDAGAAPVIVPPS